MAPDRYTQTLEWALARGLQLHDGIERRQENGVWGMYATQPVKKGAVLARFPRASVLRPVAADYPAAMTPMMQYCHAASREVELGEASRHWGLFALLETQEQLRAHSCFYFNADELDALARLNPLLHLRVQEFNLEVRRMVERVHAFDATLDPDTIAQIELNVQSRAWSDSGFLPVIDLFNHSDKKGMVRESDQDSFFLRAGCHYAPGEQLFMSYSQKDMYLHAIHYNYFDPGGQHFIHFGYRFVQSALTQFARAVMEFTAKRHVIKTMEQSGKVHYRSLDPRAVFNETEPSKELLAYLKDNCLQSEDELRAGRGSRKSQRSHILNALNALLEQNRIDQVSLQDLPPKLHRFWHLLKKEKKMLQANVKWVEKNM